MKHRRDLWIRWTKLWKTLDPLSHLGWTVAVGLGDPWAVYNDLTDVASGNERMNEWTGLGFTVSIYQFFQDGERPIGNQWKWDISEEHRIVMSEWYPTSLLFHRFRFLSMVFGCFRYKNSMFVILVNHILVDGLEHLDYFSIYWEFHHPNWRTHIFQRGRYTTNQ